MTTTALSQTEAIAGFRALGDPLRLQVVELLRDREYCVCDLCDLLSVKQSKLSFHLKTLKEANLIQGRQDGRWIYYSLNLPHLLQLQDYLASYRDAPLRSARHCC